MVPTGLGRIEGEVPPDGLASVAWVEWSGRRESNSRSQLGKLIEADDGGPSEDESAGQLGLWDDDE